MKLFLQKTAVVCLSIAFVFLIVGNSFIQTNDTTNTRTITTITYIYNLDTKQPSLDNLSMRDVFIYEKPLSANVSEQTIAFWYDVYLNLI